MAAMHRFDVVVVGGGIYGASVLYHLARRGVSTALLERGHLATGPTGRSSAVVRLHYIVPELAELARRAHVFWHHFTEETGGDAGFTEVGVAYAIGTEEAPLFKENVERLRGLGFEIEWREPDDLAELVPGFDLSDVALGVWERTSGYADPVGAVNGLADRARSLGAHVSVNAPVLRLATAGGRIAGVETEIGRLAADVVVVAAGPWTRGLVAQVGVDLPLTAERQAITILDAADARAIVPCVWGDFVERYYVRPEGPSSILIGDERPGAVVADLARWDENVSLDEASEMAARVYRRIPAVQDLGIRRGYAALYDVSPDRLHIVDRVPGVDGLFVVCGTSGHGFKMAPAIGEQIAAMIVGEEAALLHPFRFDRVFDAARERSR